MVWDNICGGRVLRIAAGMTALVLLVAGGADALLNGGENWQSSD